MLHDGVDQSIIADKMDQVKSRPESIKSLQKLQNDADWKTEGQMKSGASV